MKPLLRYFISKYGILLLACWILFGSLRAQGPGGLIFDDGAYKKFPKAPSSSKNIMDIPSFFSLKNHSPIPGSQGNIASCVGWAVGYAAMTISEAEKKNLCDKEYLTKTFAYSSSFIYNQIKNSQECNSGAKLEKAFNLLTDIGDCRVNLFSNSSINCSTLPNSGAFNAAKKLRLQNSPLKIFDYKEKIKHKINSVKVHLASGSPIIVGFNRVPSLERLKGRLVWEPSEQEKNARNIGHAMVIVSYDDRRQMLELMNSYGTSWGKGGYIWISYDDFHKHALQAYILEDKASGKSIRNNNNHSRLSYPVYMDCAVAMEFLRSKNQFEPLVPNFNSLDKTYEIYREGWSNTQNGFRFKIYASYGRYIYAFTLDRGGQANLELETDVLYSDSTLYAPNSGIYNYQFLGDEYFCVITSYVPIPDFERKITQINRTSGTDLPSKIRSVFANCLLPEENIRYDAKNAAFQSTSIPSDGTAVALIFAINIK